MQVIYMWDRESCAYGSDTFVRHISRDRMYQYRVDAELDEDDCLSEWHTVFLHVLEELPSFWSATCLGD